MSKVNLRPHGKLKRETFTGFHEDRLPKMSANCCFQMRQGGDIHRFQPCFNFSESKRKLANFERDKLGSVTMQRSRILTGRLAVMQIQCMLGSLPTTLQTVARYL